MFFLCQSVTILWHINVPIKILCDNTHTQSRRYTHTHTDRAASTHIHTHTNTHTRALCDRTHTNKKIIYLIVKIECSVFNVRSQCDLQSVNFLKLFFERAFNFKMFPTRQTFTLGIILSELLPCIQRSKWRKKRTRNSPSWM